MIKKLKTYDSDNLQIGGKNEQISRENSESFFWKEKILNNKLRDKKNLDLLTELGWKVIIIWQCEINNISNRKIRFECLLEELKSHYSEIS